MRDHPENPGRVSRSGLVIGGFGWFKKGVSLFLVENFP